MNYKKVIKDLKERNDKLQEQYRLRDIRCIHLEYENEMLKSDFEAQHELTEKYAEENKQLKENYDRIYNENCKLREEHNISDIDLLDENYRLKDNWNKLKEYIKTEIPEDVFIDTEWFVSILDKMQELGQGSDNQ